MAFGSDSTAVKVVNLAISAAVVIAAHAVGSQARKANESAEMEYDENDLEIRRALIHSATAPAVMAGFDGKRAMFSKGAEGVLEIAEMTGNKNALRAAQGFKKGGIAE